MSQDQEPPYDGDDARGEEDEVFDDVHSKSVAAIVVEKGRSENSLAELTKQFIKLIKSRENATIDLNEATTLLKVQKRRIYDITNVLEGINYIEKTQKNTIKWNGGSNDLNLEHDIAQMKKRLQELQAEEANIDKKVRQVNDIIHREFLESEELKPYHFITDDDCLQICRAMNRDSPTEKCMLIISAPKGSSLEANEVENGSRLTMDSAGKGPISVFKCTMNGIQKIGEAEVEKK